jgi:hypothetical protein
VRSRGGGAASDLVVVDNTDARKAVDAAALAACGRLTSRTVVKPPHTTADWNVTYQQGVEPP